MSQNDHINTTPEPTGSEAYIRFGAPEATEVEAHTFRYGAETETTEVEAHQFKFGPESTTDAAAGDDSFKYRTPEGDPDATAEVEAHQCKFGPEASEVEAHSAHYGSSAARAAEVPSAKKTESVARFGSPEAEEASEVEAHQFRYGAASDQCKIGPDAETR